MSRAKKIVYWTSGLSAAALVAVVFVCLDDLAEHWYLGQLKSDDPKLRNEAIEKLGRLGAVHRIPELLECLGTLEVSEVSLTTTVYVHYDVADILGIEFDGQTGGQLLEVYARIDALQRLFDELFEGVNVAADMPGRAYRRRQFPVRGPPEVHAGIQQTLDIIRSVDKALKRMPREPVRAELRRLISDPARSPVVREFARLEASRMGERTEHGVIELPPAGVQLTVFQRGIQAVPGSRGLVEVGLGDITRGAVKVSVTRKDGRVLGSLPKMAAGDELRFGSGGKWYRLTLEKLVNKLIGADYAMFQLNAVAE